MATPLTCHADVLGAWTEDRGHWALILEWRR